MASHDLYEIDPDFDAEGIAEPIIESVLSFAEEISDFVAEAEDGFGNGSTRQGRALVNAVYDCIVDRLTNFVGDEAAIANDYRRLTDNQDVGYADFLKARVEFVKAAAILGLKAKKYVLSIR